MNTLLTRDAFREGVFARDQHKCVVCGQPAVDAHHIIERRLFSDSGYYLNNGASVCAEHHMMCEMTTISVEQIREYARITKPVIPQHLYEDTVYDKWGNVVMDNGRRLRGELFEDESVQKVLKQGQVLDLFDQHVKYPRTYHLPWSPGMHDDDRMMPDVGAFNGKRVVVMEKLDGENCLPSTTRILMADWSYDTIGNLVKTNAVGRHVMGVTKDGKLSPSKIERVYNNGPKNQPWVRIRCKGPHGHSQCVVGTPSHRVYTQRGYVQLKDITKEDKCYTYDMSICVTPIQEQVLLGKLLGDGSLHLKQERRYTGSKKALVQFSHKQLHASYAHWTQQWLGDLHSGACLDEAVRYGNTTCIKSWTKQTAAIYTAFAPMLVRGVKTFPASYIEKVTPIAIAFWYMDDGSLNHTTSQQDRMLFSVCGFDVESCKNLQQALKRFNIDTTLTRQTGYLYLYVNHTNANKLAELIAPYVPKSMRYKLPEAYRNVVSVEPPVEHNKNKGRLIEMNVIDINLSYENRYTGRFDLQTETSNYFANSTLVHNCTMYNDHIHARSVSSGGHPSRNWIRAFHGRIQGNIPNAWRVNVENMYAEHSILYTDLDTYAYGFAIWDEKNCILPWQDTLLWFSLLGITPCPVIYWDIYDRSKIEAAYADYRNNRTIKGDIEGYVIRIDEPFHFSQFKHNVGKYVRKGHVQTTKHWMYGQPVVPNVLKQGLTGFEQV